MEGFFPSPPAKRSISAVASPTVANGSSKRSKQAPPPLTVPPGHVVFRLLCNVSLIGGFIGKSGAAIKKLQQDTVAKIRVEAAPSSSDDRIVIIIASSALKSNISLSNTKDAGVGGSYAIDEDTLEVSNAQHALVRVFDRILDVAAETDGVSPPRGDLVSCRLLADSSQVGSVMGKGGKTIERIRKDNCCKIRVLKGEKLPDCAGPSDELVEIQGDVFAVRKALLAVSQCLQDCPPVDMGKLIGSRSFDAVPQDTLPDLHAGLSSRNYSLQAKPNSSVTYASGVRHLPLEADSISILDSEAVQEEVVFKLLCSNDRVGGVIGKGGSIIRALQNDTGASISIGPSVPECDERLITISASQNPGSRTPAQNALCLVFVRSIEASFEKGLDQGLNEVSTVTARLVAPSNQAGCLLGKGGAIISEMRRATGTGIRIIGSEQVPKCASQNDVVIQITGKFVNVQDAIYHVTSRLKENASSNTVPSGAGARNSSSVLTDMSPYGRARDAGSLGFHTSYAVPHSLDPRPSLPRNLDGFGSLHQLDDHVSSQMVNGSYSSGLTDLGKGLTSLKGSVELGSGMRSVIVTNTTLEIMVPENVIGTIFGENGSNLARLRQISGAKVTIHEPHPGTGNYMVIISGTPDATQSAQSLIHAFLLTGRP